MGAYLSKPVTDKHSSDGSGQYVSFGACTMQGWRKTQEDAHNCILNFDKNASFFAVYDGHGGHEVAIYAAEHYPQELKNNKLYKAGRIEAALKESFLSFDRHLGSEEGLMNLELLSRETPHDENEDGRNSPDSDVADNVDVLCQEAQMPLEELIAKYASQSEGQQKLQSAERGDSDAGSSTACTSQKYVGTSEQSQSCHSIEEETECVSNAVKKNKPVKSNTDAEVSSKVSVGQSESCKPENNKCVQSNGSENGEASPVEKGRALRGVVHRKAASPEVDRVDMSESQKTDLLGQIRHELMREIFNKGSDDDDDDDDDDSSVELDESSSDDEDGTEGDEDESGNEESSPDDADEEQNEEDGIARIAPPMAEVPGMESGCTAIVALLEGKDLYVANAGDSRCVLSCNGRAIDMSTDHKPEDDLEMYRIVEAGGYVTPEGRVNGGLNLSRAFGDHLYKRNQEKSADEQMIIAKPEIETYIIDPSENDFMILACDGIWNYMSSQEVIDFVSERLSHVDKLSSICEELFDHCLAPHAMGDGTGCDNMTAVIVKFLPTIAEAQTQIVKQIVDRKSLKRNASPDSTTEDDAKRSKIN